MHKLTIRNKRPGKTSTGANTEILLDDKPLKGVRKIEYECEAGGVARVTLHMLADVTLEADTEESQLVYAVGSMDPVAVKKGTKQ